LWAPIIATMNTPEAERLSSILSRGRVDVGFRAADADEAIEILLRPALLAEGLSQSLAEAACQAAKRREQTYSTVLGPLALPHVRFAELTRIVGSLGINADGVYACFPEARIVIAFASPVGGAAEHLRFLAQVAELFRSGDLAERLLAAPDAGSVIALIRSREK
jgi:mannitol/fructose-specific phosphotransferase system IIA component (Ntr-type)